MTTTRIGYSLRDLRCLLVLLLLHLDLLHHGIVELLLPPLIVVVQVVNIVI